MDEWHAQEVKLAHEEEVWCTQKRDPGHYGQRAEYLPAHEGPALLSITDQAFLLVKDARGDDAPEAASCMDLRGFNWVIYIHLPPQLARERVGEAADDAN